MAKHKAATEVTVAPLSEKSGLELFVSNYWAHFAAVAVVIAGWIMFRHYSGLQEAEARDGSWAALNSRTTPNPFTNVPTGEAATFGQLAGELQGTAVGPWARVLEINSLIQDRKFSEASAAVERLIQENPNHLIVTEEQDFGDGRPPRTLAQNLAETIDRQSSWEAANSGLFSNPLPGEGAPRVKLKTSKGDIVLALYADEAPKHVENFLSLCTDGTYVGSSFHEIVRGSRVVAGNPASAEAVEGPALEQNSLYHFAGTLTSVADAESEGSHGTQFAIAFEPSHELDGQSVVFGAVVEGLEVVAAIGAGPTDPTAPSRPTDPATIESVEVL